MQGNQAGPDAGAAGVERRIRQIERRVAAAAERVRRSTSEITVIGVTKTVGLGVVQQAFQAGMRDFGEGRIQEAKEKISQLTGLRPRPAWHLVGHLQTNKARMATELFDIIHSVDSVRLAEAISQYAKQKTPILIQVNVSGEDTKFGFTADQVISAVEEVARLPRLEVRGLMTIAPYTDDPQEARPIFRKLRELRDSLGLEHLSMGMTDDFEVAIEEGATMVRIGRAIFGERED